MSLMAKETFSAADIPEIVKLFREADSDGSGGLDVDEFCEVMQNFLKVANRKDLVALHMQIDVNCDSTVDLGELLEFLHKRSKQKIDFDRLVFTKPFETVKVEHHKTIVKTIFRPFHTTKGSEKVFNAAQAGQLREYQTGKYFTISADGVFTVWTDSFDNPETFPLQKTENELPYMHKKKTYVNDVVYMPELGNIAVCTNDRELFFYKQEDYPRRFSISHSLVFEDNIVKCMNYWSNGTKAVFSVGNIEGYVYIFINKNLQLQSGLFSIESYENFQCGYSSTYVSTLLKKTWRDYICTKIHIFDDICSQINFFPSLDAHAVCGRSGKEMFLVWVIQSQPGHKASQALKVQHEKRLFSSDKGKEHFTCVTYIPCCENLVTGGMDGSLRRWTPKGSCEEELPGHTKPVTNIMFNNLDLTLVSLSSDKTARVWCADSWQCIQVIDFDVVGTAPITSACYNILNNELVVANSNVAKNLGRGTLVYQRSLTSHNSPPCCTLYHSIFSQVVSVSQTGMVKVWDVRTGRTVFQFKITPDQQIGLIAVSFDGPQRRLVTVSQDRKVRLWNFNNGAELKVLPVTVQKEVTAILCRDQKVSVSGRNSKTLFILDLEDDDHRFLEHAFLSDIISMDVRDNLLMTASSVGNIVIWDIDSLEALYWIKPSQSPRTHMVNSKSAEQKGITERVCPSIGHQNKTCVVKTQPDKPSRQMDYVNDSPLVCLKTRSYTPDIATLLTAADGYIYAWSPKAKGGLLGKFRAVTDDGAIITTMTTDSEERLLLAGDSTGKVYLWNIENFCFKNESLGGPFEDIDCWRVSLRPPPLLASWKAHLKGVVSVKCDSACENIITSGLDINVRLWEKTGCHIGLLGRDRWDLTSSTPQRNEAWELIEQQDEEQQKEEKMEKHFAEGRELNERLDKMFERFEKQGLYVSPEKKEFQEKVEKYKQQQAPLEVKRFINTHPDPSDDFKRNRGIGVKPKGTVLPPLLSKPVPNRGVVHTEAKYGRVLTLTEKDRIDDSIRIPCPPPKPSPNIQIQSHMSEYSGAPRIKQGNPIKDNVVKPCPPPYPAAKSRATKPKYGRVINIKQGNPIKARVIALSNNQGPEGAHLPPISSGVTRLTAGQPTPTLSDWQTLRSKTTFHLGYEETLEPSLLRGLPTCFKIVEGPEQPTKPFHLPPISSGVTRLTAGQPIQTPSDRQTLRSKTTLHQGYEETLEPGLLRGPPTYPKRTERTEPFHLPPVSSGVTRLTSGYPTQTISHWFTTKSKTA